MDTSLTRDPERSTRNLAWIGVAAAMILSEPLYTGGSAPDSKGSSPGPLELFNRQGERRRGFRHAAELDHEVRGGRRVRCFKDHDRIRFAEEPEKLVNHHVIRELGVLEQASRLFPLTRNDLELHHEEHGVTGGASRADDI